MARQESARCRWARSEVVPGGCRDEICRGLFATREAGATGSIAGVVALAASRSHGLGSGSLAGTSSWPSGLRAAAPAGSCRAPHTGVKPWPSVRAVNGHTREYAAELGDVHVAKRWCGAAGGVRLPGDVALDSWVVWRARWLTLELASRGDGACGSHAVLGLGAPASSRARRCSSLRSVRLRA
jgi:hypothetical protein